MKRTFTLLAFLVAGSLASNVAGADTGPAVEDDETNDKTVVASFEAPVQLKAGGDFIRVEQPGYASPSWADMDGDGKKDLLVGQFKDGKIKIYKNLGAGEFAEGHWLEADGQVAEIPGVW